MKRVYTATMILVLMCVFVLSGTAAPRDEEGDETAADPSEATSPNAPSNPPRSLYLQLIDGLHVTGETIDVDIETYRLEITGDVENPVSLSFQDIKEMESVTKYIVLNCPGFFTDEGDWTGVPVRKVLEQANPGQFASIIEFVSIDGSYRKRVPFDKAMEDRFLLAYKFNGKEFPPIHGYPLRLAADGEEGNVWVKWLGEIRVLKGSQ